MGSAAQQHDAETPSGFGHVLAPRTPRRSSAPSLELPERLRRKIGVPAFRDTSDVAEILERAHEAEAAHDVGLVAAHAALPPALAFACPVAVRLLVWTATMTWCIVELVLRQSAARSSKKLELRRLAIERRDDHTTPKICLSVGMTTRTHPFP